jgi:iron complex transport system ATP-binding protein
MLRTEQLKFGYNKAKYWQLSADTTFSAGQCIALIGRNGAGKSTFLRSLARQQPILEGDIYIDNQSFSRFSVADYAKQVAVVRTEKMQIPYCTVAELVAFGRMPHTNYWGKMETADKEKVAEILQFLQLDRLAQQPLDACSDGEQQLAFLGRALVQDTPIILLDEITSHLDFINRQLVFDWLQSLAKSQNKLIFMATHELDLALRHCEKLLLFDDNELSLADSRDFNLSDILRLWGSK